MSLWGKNDAASNTPYVEATGNVNKTANTANRDALYGNTTVGAFVAGQAVGTFGVTTNEMANTTGEGKKVVHAGWNLRRAGTGPLDNLVISAGGSGYSNNDTIKVAVAAPGVNATASLTTNSTGGIISTTITNVGFGFTAKNPSVAFANSTGGTTIAGSGATIVATTGGRAGRVQYETLVAMKSMTGDGSDDTQLPD